MIEVRQIDKDSIDFLIRELTQFEKNKALKSGLNAAGQVFKVGGRQRLRQKLKGSKGSTGHLMNSFKVRVKRNKAGVLTGFTAGGRHAHFVDKGTVEREHPIAGTSGKMPANHFWSDTNNQDYPKAISRIFEGIEKAIQRINDKKS